MNELMNFLSFAGQYIFVEKYAKGPNYFGKIVTL